MSNHYFQFKQFRINQERCAMKVTTDACLLGAWPVLADTAIRVLDIGTGTGLVALMLAQRYPNIQIDGIELNPEAAEQAVENVVNSPWFNRINIIRQDIRDFTHLQLYDIVITNPPFFRNSLLGPDMARNAARHTDGLDDRTLLEAAERCLTQHGTIAVLLPLKEFRLFEKLFNGQGWWCNRSLLVRNNADKPDKRVIAIMSRQQSAAVIEKLTIRDDQNEYTTSFKELLSPFYLHL